MSDLKIVLEAIRLGFECVTPWTVSGLLFLTLVFLAYGFVLFPERGDKWIAWASSLLLWTSTRIDQTYVGRDISAKLNDFRRRINSQVKGLMPYPVKIQWLNANNIEEGAFQEDEQAIIFLRYHKNQDRNLVMATRSYLKKGFMVYARHYVNKILMESIDIRIARDILATSGMPSSLDYMHEEITMPAINESPELKNYSAALERMRKKGLFTQVLLRELMNLGRCLFPESPSEETSKLTDEFAEFLDTIAGRQRGEDVDLSFSHGNINITVLLVARYDIESEASISRHIHRAMKEIYENGKRVFLCGIGKINVTRVRIIADILAQRLDMSFETSEFRLPQGDESGIVILATKNKATRDFIYEQMVQVIPEIENGDIELLEAARDPGIKTKIAVRNIDNNNDAVACCIGPNAIRVRKLEELLGEKVDIIRWNDDPRYFIQNSLRPANIAYVEVDESKHEATAFVDPQDTSIAIGPKGQNVRLAARLTGWRITIEKLSNIA